MRRRKRRRQGMSTVLAGLIASVLIVLFSIGAYTKFANPFASHFTVHATFSNANGLHPSSLVRIAGINIGKVVDVAPLPGCKIGTQSQDKCSASDVTLQIESNGLPLHRDATFWIRPRIFLEGNFFVDVSPGSPSAPTVGDGYTFPVQSGREPVQFDQLLAALPTDTRRNLQILLTEYGIAVKRGGPGFSRSIRYWTPAYKYSAIVNRDFLGYKPHDLSSYISSSSIVAQALDPHLADLIHQLNIFAGSLASQQTALQAAVAELPRTLRVGVPALQRLDVSLPPLRQLARALIPGVVSTGPSADASLPFIAQLRGLVQPAELRGLTRDLSSAVPSLARLSQATIPLMTRGVRPFASCVATKILPWSHLTVPDSHFNSSDGYPDRQTYIEGVDFLPGLAGESRNFDANGPYIRILGTGGTVTYSLQPGLFGQALAPITGVQPTLPPDQKRPALHPRVPCETQRTITDLSTPVGNGPTAMTTATSGAAADAAKAFQTSNGRVALDQVIRQSAGSGVTVKATR